MSELTEIIRARAPISVADYMDLCLSHPEHGYYRTRDPLGVSGDFVTAPEISQMFGEMIGLWLAQVWMDQGSPSPFVLAELGPGRGTLMADILRVTKIVPGFREAAKVAMVETSNALQAKQEDTVGDVTYVERIEDVPDGPLFLIANEFFDALPVRQFRKVDDFWQERQVRETMTEGWSRPEANPALDKAFPLTADARMVEVNPEAERIMALIRDRIDQNGAALVIDYGEWDGIGDTLQAIQAHAPVDVFDHDHGSADLTTHVRFKPLAMGRHAFTTQGQFLTRLGIAARAEKLAENAPDDIPAALHRLTDDGEMGSLFKVLALLPEAAPPAPGFDNDADDTD